MDIRLMLRWMTVLLLIGVCVGCDTTEPASEPVPEDDPELTDDFPINARPFRIGVSGMVPRNWPDASEADWNDLFQKVPTYGEWWGLHVGWDAALTGAHVPEQVEVGYTVTSGEDVTPYVALGFEPEAMTQAEADAYLEVHGADFEQVAVSVAEAYAPDILLLGIEVNRYWEKSPEGFEDFLAVYAATYDAVKEVSPTTKVAPNFLWEYMKGAGARSGRTHTPHLDLIDRFGTRLDLITVTVYPWLDVDHPSEIPGDYLTPLVERAGRPLMITETGWPSQDFPHEAVTATEQAQIEYLLRLLELTKDVETEALIWVFPHDPDTGEAGGIFDHVSLRTNSGSAKAAYAYWEALRDL